MSYAAYGPRPTAGWRIVNSLWMLTGFLSLGLLWFIGFWMVAIRRRTSALWYIAATVVTALDVGVIVLVALSNADPDNSALDTLGSTILGIVMLGVPAVALIMNVSWLRWLWQDQLARGTGGWTAAPAGFAVSPWTPGSAHPAGQPGANVAWGQPAPFGQYGQPDRSGQLLPPAPPAWGMPQATGAQPYPQTPGARRGVHGAGAGSAPGHATPAPAASGTGATPVIGGPPLDLNAASVAQLAALPGAGQALARAIVAERDARGAYARVSDLVARGVVQPHVFLAFSTGLFAGPLAAPPTPGLEGEAAARRSDDGGEAGGGRRLEF